MEATSSTAHCVMWLLRHLFGNAQGLSAALHLRIHFNRIDVRAAPELDQITDVR